MKYLTGRPLGVWAGLLLSSTLVFFASCKKEPPTSNGNATGYITSIDSGCSPSRTHGIWYNGVAGADSNYLEVTLNITAPGKYNISTSSQNGVSFSGSGSINEIGLYTVRLKASGTFNQFGPTSFPLRFDSSGCNFIVYVQDSAARNYPDNTWEATANGRYYKGPLTTYQNGLNLPPGQATSFRLSGSAAPVPTESAGMSLDINTGSIIDTIPYQTNKAYVGFFISSFDSAKAYPDNYIIEGFANTAEPTALMTLQIKSMVPLVTDDTYKTVVYGTFSGTIRDYWHQYHIEPVVNGKFKLVN
ncbi:MAG TPA: hypothetical protein VHC96_18980 [Puia sp.]|jgi:hypothetical protein|nr:hypothetical protein [Puia sp.]